MLSDRLPKTVDGVTIYPGMTVYWAYTGNIESGSVQYVSVDDVKIRDTGYKSVNKLYAAESIAWMALYRAAMDKAEGYLAKALEAKTREPGDAGAE